MRPLAILLAAALGACGGGAAEVWPSDPSAEGPGVAPERIGASGWSCPSGHKVTALGDVYYPPMHPERPLLRPRPDRCFATVGEAEATGYRPVPPPAGGTVLAGLYLVPPDEMLARECDAAARRARIAVACPGLVPGHAGAVSLFSAARDEVILQGGFSGPVGYEGIGTGPTGHLWVMSARPGRASDSQSCSEPTPAGQTTVRGVQARWITCPEGSEFNSGHVVLVWIEGGVSYAISLHGANRTNRRLARLLAERVELVTP